ncbi:MAG: ImmA/IrrE family metallo-endopeptidase, partial [Calditrichaeota bacterium]|nr:ImmA/IrrE family metallo-endopeptidase [Calditrichota bacterium]
LKHKKDPYALSAWLAKGEQIAKSIDAPKYSQQALRKKLPVLKKIMADKPENFFMEIQTECLEAGVKVIYTSTLPKLPINGVVRWIDENPIIQIYDRYKRYDIFWFSLFHELGHILLHGNKKNIFIEEVRDINDEDQYEKEATEFALQWLLKNKEFESIMSKITAGNEILEIIKMYAKNFGTHPDIIIGRILHQNRDLYKFGFLQNQLSKININDQRKLF